eukprot:8755039-Prorocentrum_lima.AAC.1
MRQELRKRFSTCMAVWNRLKTFWIGSSCPIKWKLYVWDAVIRAKLMYGLQGAFLTKENLRALD